MLKTQDNYQNTVNETSNTEKIKHDLMTLFLILGAASLLIFLLGGVGSLVDEFVDWGQSPWLGTSCFAVMLLAIPMMLVSTLAYAVDSDSSKSATKKRQSE